VGVNESETAVPSVTGVPEDEPTGVPVQVESSGPYRMKSTVPPMAGNPFCDTIARSASGIPTVAAGPGDAVVVSVVTVKPPQIGGPQVPGETTVDVPVAPHEVKPASPAESENSAVH
jgi:hypothetical protein